jgi:hypothetical protein
VANAAVRLAAAIIASLSLFAAVPAAATSGCAPLVLWGDGRHDDTAALNAWLRGRPVLWAQSGEAVPAEIDGNSFLLSGPIYVKSGTGRRIVRFRMIWPATGEAMTGGAIATGTDPQQPPLMSGIRKIGGDAGEGVPFDGPANEPGDEMPGTDCLVS